MDPRDTQRTTMPGQTSETGAAPNGRPTTPNGTPAGVSAGAAPETIVVRRMDPRLWALLPLIALAILGAYFVGKKWGGTPAPEPAAPPAQTPVVATAPPPTPHGKISVQEVPTEPTTPPAQSPAASPTPPVLNPTPKPKPQKQPAYHQEEPPVVLPPPPSDQENTDQGSNPGSDNGPAILPPEPGGNATNPPDDTPKPQTEADRDPVKLNDPALEYPSSAYEEGAEGTARVVFTITTDGRVQDAEIGQSSGDNRLDQAAVDYVRRLRFRPAIRNGRPTDVRASRTVRFSLR